MENISEYYWIGIVVIVVVAIIILASRSGKDDSGSSASAGNSGSANASSGSAPVVQKATDGLTGVERYIKKKMASDPDYGRVPSRPAQPAPAPAVAKESTSVDKYIERLSAVPAQPTAYQTAPAVDGESSVGRYLRLRG